MPKYVFRISQGSYAHELSVEAKDDDAAWDEAAAVCSEMIGETFKELRNSPEWRLDVADDTGKVRHVFRLIAKTLDNR
jgi:hypothetical protein